MNVHAPFTELTDLASERMGTQVLEASDDFFAPKEALIKAEAPIFLPDKYTDLGKWMDGWESRRKREPGHDWCVLKLGAPGRIHGINVDTAFFLGNYPEYASLEGGVGSGGVPTEWTTLVPKSPLRGGTQNLFGVGSTERWTHLRLNIFPDGGVARLRVYGRVVPDWNALPKGEAVDLAAVENGGQVLACSDQFFSHPENLIMPGRARHMGEGWETRRRRGPGSDWVIVKLGRKGKLKRVEVDTHLYKGNFPESCALEGVDSGGKPLMACDFRDGAPLPWKTLIPRTKLQADHRRVFEMADGEGVDLLRLQIFPDGGISRLRVFAEPL